MKQERAARTRRVLVQAAAEELDRNGYEGTSLVRICRTAEVSMGALTFHFSTKSQVADEVQAQGRAITGALVAQVVTSQVSPQVTALRAVMELIVGLAALLERNVTVRSAARLSRERPGEAACWGSAWLPAVRELLEQAWRDGELHPAAHPRTLEALVAYLMTGAEAHIRERVEASVRDGAGAREPGLLDAGSQLKQIWQLFLQGAGPAR
ncbi:TetR/AcrR family transcriptional regulator (plasmid) [Streptomyces sp. NBC_01387]|uniref:TetR/AcrR family transcriptional regulator n=1 Tax=unclassified Streptomyces TaxID=2593676 RepID=UPI0022575B06|nr:MULTISPECIES: TetR/AcrR family transcriptional regulator [unclassified Streptomyces]MCX4554473.1 TetR/AcrR family transcriptional regulator [Streptomyces sp. NBC_01500]WSC25143.1 TetR/AcrR family transcriptional regulator [Streptomyces sp. NBC_01766]WSV58976.1 TetR/AcrR family transcriptional regulator [Streptomyces sp. NBC_01014]